MKKLIVLTFIGILLAGPCAAGLFDDLTIMSEKDMKKMKQEMEQLRADNSRLREENDKLKKEQGVRVTRTYAGEEFDVMLALSELNDNDTEDYVVPGTLASWVMVVDLRQTREVTGLTLRCNPDMVRTTLSVVYYNQADERWQLEGDYKLDAASKEIKLLRPVATNRIRLVPGREIRNLYDLRFINISVNGY